MGNGGAYSSLVALLLTKRSLPFDQGQSASYTNGGLQLLQIRSIIMLYIVE